MAIGFARIEFVQRSQGQNACAKSAYISKSTIRFEGNCQQGPEVYDWSDKGLAVAHHEILLPKGVHEKFKSGEKLWNLAETKENRCNSVVAGELVLALPDDKPITLEDRIDLTLSFVQTHFVDKGLAAEIAVHAPEKQSKPNRSKKDIALDATKDSLENLNLQERDHNWHAHVLITTRRFQANGLELDDKKARDMMPSINRGKVVSGLDWGKLWTDHQNRYFQEKGLSLRVDSNGIVPQIHLGPVRMRARALSLFEEHGRRVEANAIEAKDVRKVLNAITERQSVFTNEDVDRFFTKHVEAKDFEAIKEAFWKQEEIVQLVNTKTGELLPKFSSQKVINEEKRMIRLADQIHADKSMKIKMPKALEFSKTLNSEQQEAFTNILAGRRLSCIQGYAGTGKSHLLVAVREAYQNAGYTVRAFGPDNATVNVLKQKEFENVENVYRFLFALNNSKRKIADGKEIWIVDEAGKLANRPFLEFLKEANKRGVQVIFSGDHAQLPSVGRGGVFNVFCEKYGSQVLENIQRQEVEKHREIAQHLATGELGSAMDKLCANRAIRWLQTKNEAMEELVDQWSKDTQGYSKPSTLIIAHTNDEVRVLNEMVRLIRKQRGELGDKEFSCETAMGKIYVSTGDHIEFRKNDKDMAVTNGLSGILIEAKENKFVVVVKEDGKKRSVTFNPEEYNSYQLGYASTFYRSQGQTVDKAYVLHSAQLNKEAFYVGLTRHVKDVKYFVSHEEAHCLSDLKRQTGRSIAKETTLQFTTLDESNLKAQLEQKRHMIEQLKDADSILKNIKGYGLSVYDAFKTKVGEVQEHVKDRTPNQEFFHPNFPDSSNKKAVIMETRELPVLTSEEAHIKENPSLTNLDTALNIRQSGVQAHRAYDQVFLKCIQRKSQSWEALGIPHQDVTKSYFKVSEEAASLRQVVEVEASIASKDVESTTHFKDWMEACGKRNAIAHDLINKVEPTALTEIFGKKYVQIIQDQASRYAAVLQKSDQKQTHNLEEQLKENIQPLLYRLFPEGPTGRDRTHLRFGSKGSLSVACTGEKIGQFYDFENQQGGGVFKLIQRELGLGHKEAKEWAQTFVGIAPDVKVPKVFAKSAPTVSKETEWVSVKPDPNIPAPKLEELSGKKLHCYFEEVTRHPYRDENGQLLYYVLRLRDRHDQTRKITPPLSFGYWKSNPENVSWNLKGFQGEKSVLYNLHMLKEKPNSTVLVVEGEKTADAALQKFPDKDFVCVTWSGGSGAVNKANWMPLMGRDVIVWPDNDKAGYQAGDQVCRELRMVGVKSLHKIDAETLKKHFAEKWDLADPLPTTVNDGLLKGLLDSAAQKGIDPQQVVYRISSLSERHVADRSRANEVLWRVDERLRGELEKKFGGQFWKINEEILQETAKVFVRHEERLDHLGARSKQVFEERLSWQVSLYEARQGKEPSPTELEKMREVIREFGSINAKAAEKIVNDFSLDKVLSNACDKALLGYPLEKDRLRQEVLTLTQNIGKEMEKQQGLDAVSGYKKDLIQEKSPGTTKTI